MTQDELTTTWNLAKMVFLNANGMEYQHLLNQVELYNIDSGLCYLHSSSDYVIEELNKLKEKLKDSINQVLLLKNMTVELVIKKEIQTDLLKMEVYEDKNEVDSTVEKTGLIPKFTFDSFVVGQNSEYPYQCCMATIESLKEKRTPPYNPLLIYGDSGLGKTHLAQAVGNLLIEKDYRKKVKYLTAEEFNNEYLYAIRKGNLKNNIDSAETFRQKYRNLDLIIIDDIQFFEKVFGKGDGSVEEEFFNTLNSLLIKEKQLIFISDRNPKKIKGLSDRLKSRFLSGLNAEIKKPDYSTRVAILQTICETENIQMDNTILEYIADNVTENVREMQGILKSITAKARLLKKNITIDLAKSAIGEQVDRIRASITAEKIAQAVAMYFNITEEEMKSEKRKSEILIPRQVAMYIMREKLSISLNDTGKYFNRDHATVYSAVEKIGNKLKVDENFANDVKEITKRICE